MYYNWDIEGYMGQIYTTEYPEMSIEEIHKKVYDEIREKKPERFTFNYADPDNTGANFYYKSLSENPKAFGEEIQLFAVKPLYNIVNYLFYKIGFSVSGAVNFTSIISFIFILIFIFFFLKNRLKNGFVALLFVVIITFFKPLLEASRHAAADTLAAFFLLIAVYYYLFKKNLLGATIFGMFTIFTRPEYFIFFFFFYSFLLFRKHFINNYKTFALSFLYLFLSFIIIQISATIPWNVMVMNQFLKVQLFPISNPDAFVLADYIQYVKHKIILEFNASDFTIVLFFTIISLLAKQQNRKQTIFFAGFVAVIYISVLVRFLIFPMLVNRMMVGFYLLMMLGLIIYNLEGKFNDKISAKDFLNYFFKINSKIK